MHLKKLLLAATAVTLVMFVTFSTGLRGQGLVDGIRVTLPYPVTIGEKVLEPGEYEIRRASSVVDNVLKIFNNDKMVYETNVITISTERKETPEDSKVILHHIGDEYYFDKIWIQGRSLGYEFVLPERIEALQRDLAVTVPARFEPVQAAAVLESDDVDIDVDVDVDVDDADSVAVVETPDQEEVAVVEAEIEVDSAAAEQERLAQMERDRQAELDREAQAERDRLAALESELELISEDEAAAAAPPPPIQEDVQEPEQLPATASNWLGYAAGGVLLLMLSLILRPFARLQE